MAIIGEKITLDKPLVGNIARNQMESKMELTTKGALYVGTGKANSVTPDGGGDAVPIPITSHIAPNGASDNGKVLVADASEGVGWRVDKITADNLEGGRVAQATNADRATQATQATKADTVSYDGNYKSFIDAFVSACLLKIYPVGSIYMTTEKDVNPSTFLGGTWERWGQGRVPVGVDENDTDKIFEEAGKEGGQKNITLDLANLPEHYHTIGVNKSDGGRRLITTWISGVGSSTFTDWKYSSTPTETSTILTRSYSSTAYDSAKTNSAGYSPTTPISNLQPYITCYMWKRTA